ncbi:hypothetical protein [Saccharicrinis aurantiacus]|uniref:hypothetical protein n=1 Tax=Saccharicrinis aurantiacus TaxID=1849719 RepID=UPI00249177B5|nr:hypothetical protein [Saccharicrinis aurantiacus]
MKKIKTFVIAMFLCCLILPSQAQFVDTMQKNGLSFNLRKDYKLKNDNAHKTNYAAVITEYTIPEKTFADDYKW